MDAVNQALGVFAVNRLHDLRQSKVVAITMIAKQGMGFCETCRQHKPAPKNRAKGWRCRECRDK